jgi:hypothetical protein
MLERARSSRTIRHICSLGRLGLVIRRDVAAERGCEAQQYGLKSSRVETSRRRR